MTYDEFKTYIMTHLWKMGDSVVLDSLPTIINTAEAELNRTLKVEDRVSVLDIQAEAIAWPLPPDYRSMRSLTSPYRGEMHYNMPADFATKRATGCATGKDYTVVNKTLRLIGTITPEKPLALEAWYYRNIPKITDDPSGETNWLLADYFDVYLYCVLKHTAPFLREDERLQVWGTLFSDAMIAALDENDDRKYAGSPLKIKFPAGAR
jgi:hypothetical protein